MTCFSEEKKTEIVVLNELKLLPEEANHYMSFPGYVSMFKLRDNDPRRRGGILIVVNIRITVILSFPHRSLFLSVLVPIFEAKFPKNYSTKLENKIIFLEKTLRSIRI